MHSTKKENKYNQTVLPDAHVNKDSFGVKTNLVLHMQLAVVMVILIVELLIFDTTIFKELVNTFSHNRVTLLSLVLSLEIINATLVYLALKR